MPLNIRIEGDVVVLSNFARLMNDPRYVDANADVGDLLDQGLQSFILDLGGVREPGSSLFGLLITLTRRIRRRGGQAALAHPHPKMEEFLSMMRMEDYWDVFANVQEARAFFHRGSNGPRPEDEGSE